MYRFDGGKVYDVKGTTAYQFGKGDRRIERSYTDICFGNTRLREWFCLDNRARLEYFECPTGCESGACVNDNVTTTTLPSTTTTVAPTTTTIMNNTIHSECSGTVCIGVMGPGEDQCTTNADCVAQTTTTTVEPTTITLVNWCVDTDGGNNIFNVGTVTGALYGDSYSYTDFCVTADFIVEYDCSGNYWTQINTTCGNLTCLGGACQ